MKAEAENCTHHIWMVAYTNYPSDARVRREAETLAREGRFDISFLCLKEGNVPRAYRLDGVDIRELNVSKYRGGSKRRYVLSYLRFLATAAVVLTRQLTMGSIDAVHIHNMPNFMIFSAVFPWILGKKLILDIHDSIPETFLSKFADNGKHRFIFKMLCAEESFCCRFADRIVCVNHVQEKALTDRGLTPEKLVVSMNVPDPRIFDHTRPRSVAMANDNGFKLVYHGTVTSRLGIDTAIRAVALLKERIPNMRFHVFGTGDDLEVFADLGQSMGVDDRVRFNRKMVPVEKLPGMLSHMNVGVIANRKDPATELMLPVKMLEYMSLGIPVVAPKLKAIQYYFDGNTVQYYESERADSLADAIYTLYRDEDRRQLQVESAFRFLDAHGWARHKYGIINMYHGLLGNCRTSRKQTIKTIGGNCGW